MKKKYKAGGDEAPSPGDKSPESAKGDEDPGAFIHMLKERIAPEVFDEKAIHEHWIRYGPIDIMTASQTLDDLLIYHPRNLHISFYLDHLKGGIFHEQ